MRANRDEIVAAIQVLLPLGSKPSLTSTEIDYICSLEGDYRKLAVLQAGEGQLIRIGLTIPAMTVKSQIQSLSASISENEVKQYNEKKAWADKYGSYHYGSIKKPMQQLEMINDGSLSDVPWKAADCEKCSDTGYLVNYNTIGPWGKVPCSCEKGTEKAKKTDYMGPPVLPYKPKSKSFVNPYGTAQEKQQSDKLALLQKNIAQEEAKLVKLQTATGIAIVTQVLAQGPPELPRKGRKFR